MNQNGKCQLYERVDNDINRLVIIPGRCRGTFNTIPFENISAFRVRAIFHKTVAVCHQLAMLTTTSTLVARVR